MIERAALAAARRLDPEVAHDLALRALRMGLGPRGGVLTGPRLVCRVAGLDLANPVGLAAGFDKDGTAMHGLARAGFGFLELGATTPLAQPGNPRPRLFRLHRDAAVINRFGFNNSGADAMAERLTARPRGLPVGLNLGANKDSADRIVDFAAVLRICGPHLDFATVNVSSPNTDGLRKLQGADALRTVLDGVAAARDQLPRPIPVFLKIAPDLSDADLAAIVAAADGVDAIVTTNTTTARDGLHGRHAAEGGGLSGRPLFEASTRILAKVSALRPDLPLIGVGGVGDAAQAYAKIRAGAHAVQLYTALAYRGLSLVSDIVVGLDRMLARDGFANVADAVGVDRDRWL
ncbi:quinone-dependent dihydroorotate dehydrogenase [Jannaschia sp. LMIT008]|uniref:quinone-dependent dihydroorotate dehydrogenase n=1 Tax=Jannaschia maritima TaxID=3032585 RepID=UPI002811C90D|nr:quinone-dependent dihydroorotate dehydrogenase [Jannaschia sp. LMIT008]